MIIRDANLSDASAIARLHAASWRFAYRGMLTDEYLDGDLVTERHALWVERLSTPNANQRLVLAEIDGELSGFAFAFGSDDPELGTLLDNLHVTAEFHRQGIGTKLMAEIVLWVRAELPNEGLHLWVLEANARAVRFYENLGGQKVREDIWHSPDGGALPGICYAWTDLAALQQTLRQRS